MAIDDIREAAKAELRQRHWASLRGKATRAYIREHPELVELYIDTKNVVVDESTLPNYVTLASIKLELAQRARRREVARAVRRWAVDHPEEAQRIKEEVAENERVRYRSEEEN